MIYIGNSLNYHTHTSTPTQTHISGCVVYFIIISHVYIFNEEDDIVKLENPFNYYIIIFMSIKWYVLFFHMNKINGMYLKFKNCHRPMFIDNNNYIYICNEMKWCIPLIVFFFFFSHWIIGFFSQEFFFVEIIHSIHSLIWDSINSRFF